MSRSAWLLLSLCASCVVIVAGVAMLSWPAALIVAGVAGIGLSLLFIEVGDGS